MAQLTPPGWSPDTNWFWDGREWQDAVSPDGKWRYDGKDWKRFRGKRTAILRSERCLDELSWTMGWSLISC